mmetsp:Transcript_16391/g.36975  ORF Transcript_16391/g.36975 Transcript_16391/m.36975 type:complete len:112 (-) Transcript_16391:39-374(-)
MANAAEILAFVQGRAAEFDEVHFVTAVHRVAKHSGGAALLGDPVLVGIFKTLGSFVSSMNSRHLANTLWAVARLAYRNQPFRQAISASARRTIQDFRPPELASTAWSCAAL